MKCPNCGVELQAGSLFCYNCGARITQADSEEKQPSGRKGVKVEGWSKLEPTQNVPPKPGNGMKKRIFLIVGILVAVAVAGFAIYAILNNPKNVVMKSIGNTVSALANEKTGLSDYLGLDEIRETVKTGKTRHELTASMDLEQLGAGLSGDAGADLVVDRDANEGTYGSLSFTLSDMDVQLAEFYGDKSQWVLATPAFYDGSFFVDRAQLKEMVESEELFRMLKDNYDIETDDLTKEVIRMLAGVDTDGGEYDLDLNLAAQYMDYSSDIRANLVKNAEFKKTDSKRFRIGEKDASCRGYSIFIQEEDLNALIANLGEFLKEKCVPLLEEADKVFGVTGTDYKQNIDEIIDALDAALDGDLELTVYVGPGRRLVSLVYGGEISAERQTNQVDVTLQLLGTKNPIDDMNLSIRFSNDDESLKFGFNRMLTDGNSNMNDVLDFSYEYNSGYDLSDINIGCESVLDKVSGDFSIEISGEDGSDNISFTLEGALDNVERGKSFTAVIDDIKISSGGQPLSSYLNFTLEYGVDQIETIGSGDLLSRERLDILEADDSDWRDVYLAIQEKSLELEYEMYGLFVE